MLWGFAMYRGLIEEPILDGAFRLMKVAFIMELAIGAGTYSSLIVSNIQALPDFLGGFSGREARYRPPKQPLIKKPLLAAFFIHSSL